jgi:hypothetical protein
MRVPVCLLVRFSIKIWFLFYAKRNNVYTYITNAYERSYTSKTVEIWLNFVREIFDQFLYPTWILALLVTQVWQ